MKKTFTLDSGSLVVVEETGVAGALPVSRLQISPQQIAAHRRDPDFEAALQASTLTAAEKAALPK